MSNGEFFTRDGLATGTIVEPSILKLVVSKTGSSSVWGEARPFQQTCETKFLKLTLVGLGHDRGPS